LYNIPSEAQTVYFSKQYSMFPDLPSQGFRVTTMPDGYAFTTLEGGSTTPKGGILVITDKLGNFIHTKQLLPTTNVINGLVYHPEDSTFHIWGDYFIGAGKNLYHPYLLKTNWWGDTLWVTEFNHPAFNLCRNAIELPDGSFILAVGTSTSEGSIIGLIRVDKDGNELWHKAHIKGFANYETYGLNLKNDSTLMVGYNAIRKFIDTLDLPYDAYGLMEIDFNGKVLRDTFYPTPYWDNSQWQGWLMPLGNDRLAFTNRTVSLDQEGLQWINAIDMDYNLLWKKYASDIGGYTYLPALTSNRAGNVVGGGIIAYDSKLFPHIFQMDPEGEIVWERFAQTPIKNQPFLGGTSFECIRQTDDGGYIAVGNFQHPDYTFQTWLLKLDSLGCFEPGCQDGKYVTVGIQDPKAAVSNGLLISPNPADVAVQIQAQKGPGLLFFNDPQGRPMDTAPMKIEGTLHISTQNWPPGTYIVRYLSLKGELLGIQKMVVAHG
jgi:hypothetical protein